MVIRSEAVSIISGNMKAAIMTQQERQSKMLGYLASKEYLGVSDAAGLFNASLATVRRDFDEIVSKGLASRFRGGVRVEKAGEMVSFDLRQCTHAPEKEAVAKRASELIAEGDVVFIDGGTTTYQMAMFLPDIRMTVVTNSIRLADALERRTGGRRLIEIYLTGGRLLPDSGMLVGPGARAGLAPYHAAHAFLSAGGITERGIYNTNEQVVEAERVMIDNADKTVVLIDHAKLGRTALCHVAPLDRVSTLIIDVGAVDSPVLKACSEFGVEVLICNSK